MRAEGDALPSVALGLKFSLAGRRTISFVEVK